MLPPNNYESSAGWTAANGGGACAWSLPGQGICVVGSLSCWRMGCASRAQGERASEAVDGVPVEMDLQYRDIEKSASAAISLCALDESDDRHADSAPIRHQAQCDLGGSIVGANGVELPKAAEPGVRAGCDAGQAMDRAGFSQDFALWRKSSVLSCFLPMRAACDLTFMPGRPGGVLPSIQIGRTHPRPASVRGHRD